MKGAPIAETTCLWDATGHFACGGAVGSLGMISGGRKQQRGADGALIRESTMATSGCTACSAVAQQQRSSSASGYTYEQEQLAPMPPQLPVTGIETFTHYRPKQQPR